jgi:septin family protein
MRTNSSTITKSEPEKKSINLRALAYQMESLAALEERITGNPCDQDFRKYAKITAAGIFRIVVMGEIKKGKSSLINALIGTENLVPVHSDVATSTVFKIHYGPEVKYTVYFEAETGKEKKMIPSSDVDKYGTESGNPDNVKRVEYIRVESPAPILKNGLVIVDTPGVGGLFKKHREITWRHAPDADAVFFITESDGAPIGEDEVSFLKELKSITPLITFIQTKSTKVDQAARKSRMENNLSILRNQVGIEDKGLQYFIVDSKLKVEADQNRDADDLNDSGFGPLMSYLNNTLRKRQEINIAQMAIRRALARTVPLAQTLKSREEILKADTSEKRTKLNQEISDLQTKITDWDKTSKPRILEEFRKGLSQISRQAQQDLTPIKPGGDIQVEFERSIEEVTTTEEVQKLLHRVESDLAALTSEACLKIAERAKSGSTELLFSLQTDIVQSMSDDQKIELFAGQSVDLDVNTSAISRIVRRDTSDASILPDGAFSGFVSGGTSAMVLGMLAGSIVPGLGTIVGGAVGKVIGGIWMAHTNIIKMRTQKLEALKRESFAALQQGMASAHQAASTLINNLILDIQMETSSFIQKSITQTNDNLLRTRSDLNQRQKATLGEVAKSQKEVSEQSQKLQTIQKSLAVFQSAIAA